MSTPFTDDVDAVLKRAVPGLAIKHGANPVEVTMAAMESLAGWTASVSPTNTAKYLAALSWVMRDKALSGEPSDAALAELGRSILAVQEDVQLLVQNTEGHA